MIRSPVCACVCACVPLVRACVQHLNLVVVQGFTLVLVEDAIEVIVSVFDWDEGGKDDCVGAVKVRGEGGGWCHRVHLGLG